MPQQERRLPRGLGRFNYWEYAIARPDLTRREGSPSVDATAMRHLRTAFQYLLEHPDLDVDELARRAAAYEALSTAERLCQLYEDSAIEERELLADILPVLRRINDELPSLAAWLDD
jgi:hypothetical protein